MGRGCLLPWKYLMASDLFDVLCNRRDNVGDGNSSLKYAWEFALLERAKHPLH